ncbi:TPA: hypothetical protein ACN6VW_000282 [Serratia marcescens]|uniref:hypothetical protein n=1 Tax=Serratia TaxID=613 RepID=UPI0030B53E96
MIFKSIIILLICVFIFLLGFFLGGVHWEWARSPNYSTNVAFWGMIGGWLSGFATLAAVIVSLYMAYQASQAGVENLQISLDSIVKESYGDDHKVVLNIKSLRNVRAEVSHVRLLIDNAPYAISLNGVYAGGAKWPIFLERTGQVVKFDFNLNAGVLWWPIFSAFDRRGDFKFKKGFFIVETTMKKYKVAVPRVFLNVLLSRYESFKKMQ